MAISYTQTVREDAQHARTKTGYVPPDVLAEALRDGGRSPSSAYTREQIAAAARIECGFVQWFVRCVLAERDTRIQSGWGPRMRKK